MVVHFALVSSSLYSLRNGEKWNETSTARPNDLCKTLSESVGCDPCAGNLCRFEAVRTGLSRAFLRIEQIPRDKFCIYSLYKYKKYAAFKNSPASADKFFVDRLDPRNTN